MLSAAIMGTPSGSWAGGETAPQTVSVAPVQAAPDTIPPAGYVSSPKSRFGCQRAGTDRRTGEGQQGHSERADLGGW